MDEPSWHLDALHLISSAVAGEPAVEELWAFGSVGTVELDEGSDVDVALVAPAHETARLASPGWLSFLGSVWAHQVSAREHGAGLRAVFRDGRWVDLIVVDDREAIPGDHRRIELPRRKVEPPERAPAPDPTTPVQVNEFRFTAALAVAKAARHDLLIGGHLALDLPRQCLVLSMMLRDREAGTTHHRTGGLWNDVLDRVLDLVPNSGTGREGVLDLVDTSVGLFDDLASTRWPEYVADWSGLKSLLDHARGP